MLAPSGGNPSFQVLEAAVSQPVLQADAMRAVVPASALKIITTLAALSALGPEHRFATRATTPSRGVVVLVGGGDPYLNPEQLQRLAAQTAQALRTSRQTKIRLDWNTALFTGPEQNPEWLSLDRAAAGATAALRIQRSGGTDAAARAAGETFASALEREGITATLGERTTATGAQLATVTSLPLASMIKTILTRSDNAAAEVLFRQVAIAAKQPGTITAAQRAVPAELARIGLPTRALVISDGSGLARSSRTTPALLASAIRLSLDPKQPRLAALAEALPRAGLDGTLKTRFSAADTAAARNVVRAKTGTLRGVQALVGYTRTRSGTIAIFAFVITGAARDRGETWLDRAAATITSCGC